jgi:hypothetical protein
MTQKALYRHIIEGTQDAIVFTDREEIIQLWTEPANCQRKFAAVRLRIIIRLSSTTISLLATSAQPVI